MPKGIKPEKVAGIVALSYLVLIPAGAYYAWARVKDIETDVNDLWERAGYPPHENRGIVNLAKLKQAFTLNRVT